MFHSNESGHKTNWRVVIIIEKEAEKYNYLSPLREPISLELAHTQLLEHQNKAQKPS